MKKKSMKKKIKKICMVISYFGKWPKWFGYFLKSCKLNPTINWLIYTNCKIPKKIPKNIRFIKASLEDFNKLASKKLNLKINIKNPYKLCDFKPAYGIIFEDYLSGYDFWGHTDLDVIYGDIRKFITNQFLLRYDIITARKEFLVGHFTIYKNTNKVNNLFKKHPDYKKAFQTQKHLAFDECHQSHQKLLKRKKVKESILKRYCMDWLIKDLTKKGEIKSYYKNLMFDGTKFNEKFKFIFNAGRLFEEKTKKEIMYLHIHQLGHILFYEKGKIPNKFYITNKDMFHNKATSSNSQITIRILKRKINIKIHKILGEIGNYLWKNHPKLYIKMKNKK